MRCRKIINSRYVFDFAKYDFVPKSIVILAVEFDLVELTFTYQGKRVKIYTVQRRAGSGINEADLHRKRIQS